MQRPKRSTRGAKPQKTAEQLEEEQKLYMSLFGAQALQQNEKVDPEQQKKELARLSRNERLKSNLEKYAYVRAFHYYCNLDDIPRLEGHPSYAIPGKYGFGWNNSKDDQFYGKQTLGTIVNRLYVGLPRSQAQPKKEQDDQTWEQTFQLQERRYSIDRILYTCKILLQRLTQLVKDGKIKEFRNIAKRDSQFQLLWEDNTSLQAKKHLLRKKVKEFERKRELRVKVLNDQEHKLLVQAVEKEQAGVGVVGIEEEGSIPLKKIKLS